MDVVSKDFLHYEEEDCEFSEPVFVRRPGGSDEDDGVVLVSVFNMKNLHEAGLVILDAGNLQPLARAKVQAKGQVTHCFHGQFAQDQDILHVY